MLHTVNKSPFERNSLETCLRFAREGDAVLLYEDGIYAALTGTSWEATIKEAVNKKRNVVYVLVPDLEARGMRMDNVITDVKAVDYAGFVDLVKENNPVQAWL
jgi:tRNA 2-thiouridine synthesizing protein B